MSASTVRRLAFRSKSKRTPNHENPPRLRTLCVPGLDMVVTVLAGRYNDFTMGSTLASRILRDYVIAAVRSGVSAGCPGS